MISAILLAAGQSKRMNGENKLTKEIQNIPLIKHSVKNILASSIDELIIVLGYQQEIIEELIDKNEQGNPILFSISMKKKIMAIEGDIGAKKILELNKDKILNIETNDQSIAKNFNTPDNFRF